MKSLKNVAVSSLGLVAASPMLNAASLLELDAERSSAANGSTGSRYDDASPSHSELPENVIVSPFAGMFSGLHIAPAGPSSWKRVTVAGQSFYANKANARRAMVAMTGGTPGPKHTLVTLRFPCARTTFILSTVPRTG